MQPARPKLKLKKITVRDLKESPQAGGRSGGGCTQDPTNSQCNPAPTYSPACS
jgi:hypothetical protein